MLSDDAVQQSKARHPLRHHVLHIIWQLHKVDLVLLVAVCCVYMSDGGAERRPNDRTVTKIITDSRVHKGLQMKIKNKREKGGAT